MTTYERRHHRKSDYWQLAAFLVLAIAVIVGFWRINHNTQTNRALIAEQRIQDSRTTRQICVAVNNLNKAITSSLERAREALPTVTYFRTHTAELREQLGEINRELHAFRPRTCL
jgi:type VI protein secretion system component VasK